MVTQNTSPFIFRCLVPWVVRFLFSFFIATSHASISMPAIFGDHMVLQQGTSLPLWGEAIPGEKVTVRFVGQVVTTIASERGHWSVNLQPVYLRSSPDILIVEGEKSPRLEFIDVIMGDVWLCSGQSNMAFPLRESEHAEETIGEATDDLLRFFVVTERHSLKPEQSSELKGRWQRCTPEAAASFSAVGYFFGRDVRKATGMPLGLIGSYCYGSSAQAWVSLNALKESPSFSCYLAEYNKGLRNFSAESASYLQRKENYQIALTSWEKEVGVSYEEELEAWRLQCKEACRKLWAQPVKPEPLVPKPKPPLPPDGGVTFPTSLFNGMIAPLIPYAITGVLWYQGESNDGVAAFEYRRLFLRLIRSWRAAWGEGPFPFYFVSLAGFHKSAIEPVELLYDEAGNINPGWAWVREGQSTALSLPETGMAVATDLGNPTDIHPKDKLNIGRRLALLARKNIYGEQVVATGPVYRSMKIEGSQIRLAFDDIGKGLTIAAPPWQYNGVTRIPLKLEGFAIAGKDRRWKEASAIIRGKEVIVSNDLVKKPTAVRYNWADNPSGNLYNKEGLPAAPFRTDLDQPR